MDFIKKAFGFISDFVSDVIDDNVSVYAAQASFFMIISSIPFLMLLLGLAKYLIPFTKSEILSVLAKFLPSNIFYFTSTIIDELFSKSSGSLISITALAMLWSASRGVLSIIQGLNVVFEAEKYNFVTQRLFAFLYTFLFILTLAFTLFVLIAAQTVIGNVLLYIPLLFVIITVIVSAIYTFLPKRKSKFSEQLAGGALTSASWIIFSWLYSIYIENFSNFSYVYGSLTAVVLLMLWLYFCMMLFLCGAEFNQHLSNENQSRRK